MREMSERLTCIVIGATGGIGSEIARGLARGGNNLVLGYHTAADKAEHLSRELRGLGVQILTCRIDATDQDAVAKLVSRTLATFGGIDVLVNTQGWLHELGPFHHETKDNIDKTIALELYSVIHTCQAVIPSMIAQKRGRIISVGSDAGKVGSGGGAVSAACRAGIIGLSKSIARELATYNITANVVCPGPTESPLLDKMPKDEINTKLMASLIKAVPMRRLATPQEVAALAVFLTTPEAGFITGQAISVSGGLTMN